MKTINLKRAAPESNPLDAVSAAKLSERKTVHEWLNEAGVPTHEETGKPMCLLRRLAVALGRAPHRGNRISPRKEFMKITKEHLRKDIPPVLYNEDGACNFVLALYRAEHTPEVCSPWQTSNTLYYRKNRKMFHGWVEIEFDGCLKTDPRTKNT